MQKKRNRKLKGNLPHVFSLALGLILLLSLGKTISAGDPIPQNLSTDDPADGDALFDTTKILEVKIEIKDQDWTKLCKQTRNFFSFLAGMKVENPYNYFPATVWINGQKIENVGVRKKGLFGSQDSVRPSLKIKFDEYQKQKPFTGINRITLNNNKQDASQVSQIMTYEIFRKAGIEAPRASFAKVIVNGKDLGIYTHVESVKKPFLRRTFGTDDGHLYEGTVADFYTRAVQNMEAKTKKKSKHKHINKLAKLLTQESVNTEELGELVDLDAYYRFWVVEGLIRYWDGYSANQNNYFYYVHPEKNKGYFIPWGTDASFMQNGGPFNNNQKVTAIYANGYLPNRLFHQEGGAERYKKEMQKVMDEVWDEEQLIARVDELAELVKGKHHSTQKGSEASLNQTKEFISKRRKQVEGELESWPPEISSKPRKPIYGNEIGTATGKFSTTWREKRSRNPTKEGEASIQLKMDGEVIEFSQVGVVVQEFKFPTFGNNDLNPDPPVDLVLAAVRKKDNKRMTLSLYIGMEDYLKRKTGAFDTFGMISEGRGGAFAGFGNKTTRSVEGTVTFTKTSNKVGEPVAGSFELNVIEMRGGLFNRD